MAYLNGKLINTTTLAATPQDDDDWMPEGARVVSEERSRPKKGPDELRSMLLGFSQGGSGGFLDEAAGGLANLFGAGGEPIRAGVAAPPELRAAIEAQPSFGERLKGRMREDIKQAQEAHPEFYIPGEVAGMAAQTYLGGKAVSALGKAVPAAGKGLQALAAWAKANPLAAATLAGAGQGGAYSAGTSEAKDATGVLLDTALGTALGAGAGALGHGAGKLVGKGLDKLRGRATAGVAKASQDIAELGQKAAAEQTASARSAAGRAAQDAYRQLEHLRALDKLGALSPEQRAVAEQLAEELAQKAQENLLPAAAEKAATSAAYKEALATEGARAAAAEKEIGSVWNQLKPRLKRYAIPAIAGAVGLPAGGPVGAGIAAAAGRGVSPAVQALGRMAKHPATRRAAWSLLGGGALAAEAAAPVASKLSAPVARALQLELDDPLVAALADMRGGDEEDAPEVLANALRSGR